MRFRSFFTFGLLIIVLGSCATQISFEPREGTGIPSNANLAAKFSNEPPGGIEKILRGIGYADRAGEGEQRTLLIEAVYNLLKEIENPEQRQIIERYLLTHFRHNSEQLQQLQQLQQQALELSDPANSPASITPPETAPSSIATQFFVRQEQEPEFAWYYRLRGAVLDQAGTSLLLDAISGLEGFDAFIAFARAGNDAELLGRLNITSDSSLDFQRALRSVVTIYLDEGIRFQSGVGVPRLMVGSGFFLDSEGHILTNYHVIRSQVDPEYEGKSKLTIKLNRGDGREDSPRVPARVLAWDPVLDLAILKTEVPVPGFSTFAAQDALSPGQRVFAIGSPGGLESTVTAGIVSAAGRRFLQLGEVYQVDIPINPGNSGGPVFSENGMVVGVAFAGIPQYQGINFIIPSQLVLLNMDGLSRQGKVIIPWLGFSVFEHGNGFYVSYIHPDAPQSTLEIPRASILNSIDGRVFRNLTQLQLYLMQRRPGEVLSIRYSVLGQSAEKEALVLLGERPEIPMESVLGPVPAARWMPPLFGFELDRLSAPLGQDRYKISRVFPGSPADQAGLSEHDSFSLLRWLYNSETGVAAMLMHIDRASGGYVTQSMQLAVYISINNFI